VKLDFGNNSLEVPKTIHVKGLTFIVENVEYISKTVLLYKYSVTLHRGSRSYTGVGDLWEPTDKGITDMLKQVAKAVMA